MVCQKQKHAVNIKQVFVTRECTLRPQAMRFNVKGKRKIKTEIPKTEVKADAMDTERHKVASIFALNHLFPEDCRGYGD